MIDVLGVLMGVDMQGFTRPEGSDELPPGLSTDTEPPVQSSPSSYTPPQPSSSKAPPAQAAPPAATEDVEMEDADDEEAQAKKEAEATKKTAGEAYKRKDFEEAAELYQKAWDTWPKDITFLTNLGGMYRSYSYTSGDLNRDIPAVYFEQGEYDKAIETCEKAVDEGRSVRPFTI